MEPPPSSPELLEKLMVYNFFGLNSKHTAANLIIIFNSTIREYYAEELENDTDTSEELHDIQMNWIAWIACQRTLFARPVWVRNFLRTR